MRNNIGEEPEFLLPPLIVKTLISWHLLYPGVGENILPGESVEKIHSHCG